MHYDGTLPIEKRDDGDYELEFSHVSFRYPGTEKDVLSDVSLRFKVREKLAVVGRNGAGKTTLIKLLLRLYEPTSGTITLNGIDIGKYDYQEYVQIFAAVFQDFRIYHLPLDENLAGSENVDAERVKTVLEQVGLRERVARMKDGAHTLLGHDIGDGELLSGGEEQKLAIARALYKDAPFVILDENGKPLTGGDNERRFFEASWMHKYNGKYYIGGVHTNGDFYISDDLVHWGKPVHVVSIDNDWIRDSKVGNDQIHANHMLYDNGTFHLYWSVNYWGKDKHAVHIVHAQSDSILGPYIEPV